MDDRTLYETILGLREPWHVVEVEVETAAEEVIVRLDLEATAELTCPECGERVPGYDRAPERRWRHLDTCQYRTVLSARVPRIECPEHGVRQIRVPWAEDRSRFTALFEAMAIRLLRETTVSGLGRLMGLSWDEAEGILERAVARGLERRTDEPLRFLGIDETSFQKRHEYVTIVADLERERVVWVGDHRRRTTLDGYWGELTLAARAHIEEVVMDMWQPYIQSTIAALPSGSAKIVIDRFHVAQHLNRAVDRTRRAEHRALSAQGDDRLKKTRYIWIKGQAKRKLSEELRIDRLRRSGLKVGRAWAIKEAIRKLWTYRSKTWALKYFRRWYAWAIRSRLPEMIQSARMMKRHLPWILNYLRFRHTNALTEGLNAKIQELKYRARGYRNRDNFRRAILFHCGNLDMNPL